MTRQTLEAMSAKVLISVLAFVEEVGSEEVEGTTVDPLFAFNILILRMTTT